MEQSVLFGELYHIPLQAGQAVRQSLPIRVTERRRNTAWSSSQLVPKSDVGEENVRLADAHNGELCLCR